MQITFPAGLTLLFIALKLTHVIDWEWVWVLSPLWISFLVGVGFFFLWLLFVIIAAVLGKDKPKAGRFR